MVQKITSTVALCYVLNLQPESTQKNACKIRSVIQICYKTTSANKKTNKYSTKI